jgi:mono/diheme cytochrome c family protein
MKKIALGIFIALIGVFIGLYVYAETTWATKYDAPFPNIIAVQDSSVIARGQYLVNGPAHCNSCHAPVERFPDVEAGIELPLTGGWSMDLPGVATLRAPNITPDPETGIGNLTDAEIARSLRHSISRDGRIILPLMPFQDLSDDDLTAIISYLRAQEPVPNKVQPTEYKFLGKTLIALGLLKPEGPTTTPLKHVSVEKSATYGRYLVYSVANCRGCHTLRDLSTGEYTGPDLAGGLVLEAEAPGVYETFVSPNLTPDPETGLIANWTQEMFIARMTSGRVYEHSPMPWGPFSRMDSTDLIAIYNYLQSIEPVYNPVPKTFYPPGEKPAN